MSRASSISTTAEVTLASAHATDGLLFDGDTLTTIHGPRYRMLVIGAGQLSKYLAQIAVGLDYQVTVCDPREEYTETWDVPGVRLVKTMPDDTVVDMKLDERCAVVALTHDPKLDDLALMEALKSRAFYVGALGSRANNVKRRKRLEEFDLTPRADRAAARPDRPVHRQPHAAGDRDFHPRRDHGDQERRRAARRGAGGDRQGKARSVGRLRDHRRLNGRVPISVVLASACVRRPARSASTASSASARQRPPATERSRVESMRARDVCAETW